MANNVMLYIDDIQHTHPEFLQKFISLSDGTRRIEGVWKGQTRTHDMRGKRFCVVMSGNPYTESGERSEEHTSELQSPCNLVCRLLLEKKKNTKNNHIS